LKTDVENVSDLPDRAKDQLEDPRQVISWDHDDFGMAPNSRALSPDAVELEPPSVWQNRLCNKIKWDPDFEYFMTL